MRTLLSLVTLVSAVLVPWSSLTPALLQDASGSSIGNATSRPRHPVAFLDPTLGILPLGSGTDQGTEPVPATKTAEPLGPGHDESSGLATAGPGSRVVCNNGVCQLVDDSISALGASPTRETCEPLERLHATQIRLDQVSESQWRCSCSVPVTQGSKILRRFEGTAASDVQAVQQVCGLIDSWLQARQ